MESNHPNNGFIQPLTVSAGFTLIELLVVLTIIVVITAVVITGQGTFNKTLILSNTAYDIALALRSAQTYGLGSRATGTTINAGYGLRFQNTPPDKFTLFADNYPMIGQSGLCHTPPVNDPVGPNAKPGNCVYDYSQGEKVTDYSLGNGITIMDFCAYSGSWSCVVANGGGLFSLDIVFLRPNPNPFIRVNGDTTTTYTRACIAITSPQGGAGYVSVTASGQIIANATSCP